MVLRDIDVSVSDFSRRFWWCAPDKVCAPEPVEVATRAPKGVLLPNGKRLPLSWYRPPSFRRERSTIKQVMAMDAAYQAMFGTKRGGQERRA